MQPQVSKLKIDDQDFIISRLIDRCPRTMMLRELVQNAIEAASQLREGQGVVRICAIDIDGARKLRIWNTAIALNRRELHRMCDLASSVNKQKALNLNFGMGAKVASLGANPLGLRYRSCKNGQVHEVVLGKRSGVYGRVWQSTADGDGGSLADIVDVTDKVVAEGGDVDTEWVEVVLLGNKQQQDTVADPYDGDPEMSAKWILEALYLRFFRIPDNVKLILEPDVTGLADSLEFKPLEALSCLFERWESVALNEGVKVHYGFNPSDPQQPWRNKLSANGLENISGVLAVVHRGEMYDVRRGSPWAYVAPTFGVARGGKHAVVIIELADDFPVIIDGYRQFIRYSAGEQLQIYALDFAQQVRAGRPQWLIECLALLGGHWEAGHHLQSELRGLASRLNVSFSADQKSDLEIVVLTDADDIRGRWLMGRAAAYYPDTAQLFINSRFESVGRLSQELRARLFGLASSEQITAVCADVALTSIIKITARALLYGLSMASQTDLWHPGHIEKAISPEALSVYASDIDFMIDQVASEVKVALGV